MTHRNIRNKERNLNSKGLKAEHTQKKRCIRGIDITFVLEEELE
jgi:hypothetical protein